MSRIFKKKQAKKYSTFPSNEIPEDSVIKNVVPSDLIFLQKYNKFSFHKVRMNVARKHSLRVFLEMHFPAAVFITQTHNTVRPFDVMPV